MERLEGGRRRGLQRLRSHASDVVRGFVWETVGEVRIPSSKAERISLFSLGSLVTRFHDGRGTMTVNDSGEMGRLHLL